MCDQITKAIYTGYKRLYYTTPPLWNKNTFLLYLAYCFKVDKEELKNAVEMQAYLDKMDGGVCGTQQRDLVYPEAPWSIGRDIRSGGLIEDVCEHGVGHPNAYSLDVVVKLKLRVDPTAKVDYIGMHGCDGCCGKTAYIETSLPFLEFEKRLLGREGAPEFSYKDRELMGILNLNKKGD